MSNHKDQEFLIQKIRTQYTEPVDTELDRLKTLDAKVKKPANLFGILYGTVGALILGTGMSLIMTDLGEILGMEQPLVPGVWIGLVGLLMTVSAYPLYQRVLNARKRKYAAQILTLSDQLSAK